MYFWCDMNKSPFKYPCWCLSQYESTLEILMTDVSSWVFLCVRITLVFYKKSIGHSFCFKGGVPEKVKQSSQFLRIHMQCELDIEWDALPVSPHSSCRRVQLKSHICFPFKFSKTWLFDNSLQWENVNTSIGLFFNLKGHYIYWWRHRWCTYINANSESFWLW